MINTIRRHLYSGCAERLADVGGKKASQVNGLWPVLNKTETDAVM